MAHDTLPEPSGIPLDPDAWRFAVPAFLLTVVPQFFGLWWVAIPPGIFLIIVLGFFRDPRRVVPGVPADAVSPADGKVTAVETVEHPMDPSKQAILVRLFLSVLDVHVNRFPLKATVTETLYRPGRFLDARHKDCPAVNERMTIRCSTEFGPMELRQISGKIARRIVCRVEPGKEAARGERLGLIRFGSCTEVYLPLPAQVTVKVGDMLAGGSSVIAKMG